MAIKEEDIRRCFDRLTSSGDLLILHAIISDARALVEHELLGKLATFPITPDDLAAFAYRQGWLRSLVQMQALFQPASVASKGRGPTAAEIAAFRDGELG